MGLDSNFVEHVFVLCCAASGVLIALALTTYVVDLFTMKKGE